MNFKLSAVFFLTMLLFPDNGAALQYRCATQSEIVLAVGNPASVETICLAAEKALRFLSRYELHPRRSISLNIVDTPISSEGYDAFGRYDIRTDVIDLMSYPAIFAHVRLPEMYGEPFDEVHYSGAIAHEVAHAVMQHNLMAKHISPAPQEYLAHATQLAVLPANRRNAIIQTMDVGPWEPGDAISDIYMAMEPGKFAVKSYVHLTTMEEPVTFVQILLKANWFYVYVP